MRNLIIVAGFLVGCGGASAPAPRPMGVADHLEEARRHEEVAARNEDAASEGDAAGRQPSCGGTVVDDTITSGGERLVPHAPCWTGELDVIARQRAAARERADADEHRAQANRLLATAHQACEGLPPRELDHTPFAHRADVEAVTAELTGDRVRGARIRFRVVEGLTAAWLDGAIACHRARAATLGYDPTYMGYDPSLLAGTDVEVRRDGAGLVVVIRAHDDATGLAVYGRAEDLLREER